MPPWDRYAAQPSEEEDAGPWARYRGQQGPARSAPPQRGQSAPFWDEVTGALANINRGLPFAQDVIGAVRGVEGMTRGRPFSEGYQQSIERDNADADQFMARRPNVANLAIGTGAAAPLALSAGATGAPQMAAQTSRGLPLFLRQTAQAGATGAAAGEVYGIGTSAGRPLQERLDAGNDAATVGGLTGAVTPAAVNVAAPVVRSIFGAARRLPTPAPNTLGANGGNLRIVPPPAQGGGPRIPVTAMNTIERLQDRSGQSVSQLEARFGNIQRNPQGEVLADAFDTPGVQTLRPIAQSPGRTGQRVAQTARARVREAQPRIMRALNQGLGTGESRQAAMARLEGSYRDLSANAYNPLWRQRLGPEQRALYEQRIAPLLSRDNPNPEVVSIMQRALKGARRQFNLDLANGRVTGTFDDNLGRGLHYIKMELGSLAQFEASPLRGASGNRIGGLREMYRQFGDLLDPGNGQPAIIPGYRQITQEAGDYFSAREALDAGEAWLKMNPEEVAAQRAAMSPFELRHARTALADAVRHATRGRVVGNKNVANALDDPSMQEAIAAAFDNPSQAADFLETVNTQNQLTRNALDWGGGAQTWANAMYGADEAAQAMVEAGMNVATGRPATGAAQAGRQAMNAISGGMIERANNVRGEALLTRIDTEDAQSFTRAIIAELRRREALRAANSRVSRVGGAAAGSQQGRRK